MNRKRNNAVSPDALVFCCGDHDAHGSEHPETMLTPLQQLEELFCVRFYQTQPGGSKDLIDPETPEGYREVVIRQLKNALKIKEYPEYVIIVHHHNCGAYAHLLENTSPEVQLDFHIGQLALAKELIHDYIPDYNGKVLEYYLHHDGLIRPASEALCFSDVDRLSA